MEKKAYKKPSMMVVELQNITCLLQASQTPPNEIPDYDDWLDSRQYNGDWEEEDWEEEEETWGRSKETIGLP